MSKIGLYPAITKVFSLHCVVVAVVAVDTRNFELSTAFAPSVRRKLERGMGKEEFSQRDTYRYVKQVEE